MNPHPDSARSDSVSRRSFLRTGATAAAAVGLLPGAAIGPTGASRSDPGWFQVDGVRIGAITYSYRALPGSAEQLLGYLQETGVSVVELMGGPAEQYAGGPEAPPWPGGNPSQWSEEERRSFDRAREQYAEEAAAWRRSASMDGFEELGTLYANGGLDVDILKLGDPEWSDEEIDYAFRAARAVGARGISFEISDEAARRMGAFATKHEMVTSMHNHTQVGDPGFSFEEPLSYSEYNMLNLDVGHYVAGTDESPIPVIERFHDRITHLHLKDRKKGSNGGDNVRWGEGDTPLVEILQLLRDEQYPIPAMIELEYPIPEDSDVITEMQRCVDFCRQALA